MYVYVIIYIIIGLLGYVIEHGKDNTINMYLANYVVSVFYFLPVIVSLASSLTAGKEITCF